MCGVIRVSLRMPDEILLFRTLPVYAYLAAKQSTHYKMPKTDINISVDLSLAAKKAA